MGYDSAIETAKPSHLRQHERMCRTLCVGAIRIDKKTKIVLDGHTQSFNIWKTGVDHMNIFIL